MLANAARNAGFSVGLDGPPGADVGAGGRGEPGLLQGALSAPHAPSPLRSAATPQQQEQQPQPGQPAPVLGGYWNGNVFDYPFATQAGLLTPGQPYPQVGLLGF